LKLSIENCGQTAADGYRTWLLLTAYMSIASDLSDDTIGDPLTLIV